MAARYRHPTSSAAQPSTPSPTSSQHRTPSTSSSDSDSEARKTTKNAIDELKSSASTYAAEERDHGIGVLDVLRILSGIIILSCGLSYLATSGDSMTWGYNAWWTRAREWKNLWQGQITLTDTELLAYDGTDPSKPIYLALNGTIYDVSANPKTYGPGGSYHFFAGRDAARAYLTGCFMEDQTPDLRGVEEMFMPIDPEDADTGADSDAGEKKKKKKPARKLSKAEIKNRHAKELRKARQQVREGLEHWHTLFRGDKGKPYFKVGEVKREKGWLEKLPRRELCKEAKKSRPIRKEEGEE